MPNFASIQLIGHLGRDPETRQVGDSQVASFSIAVSEKVKGEEVTSWFDCNAWGKQAEIISKYLHKGDAVMVQGRPRIEEYESKKEPGAKKMKVSVRVSEFTLLGGKKSDAGYADQPAKSLSSEVGGKIAAATGDEPPF